MYTLAAQKRNNGFDCCDVTIAVQAKCGVTGHCPTSGHEAAHVCTVSQSGHMCAPSCRPFSGGRQSVLATAMKSSRGSTIASDVPSAVGAEPREEAGSPGTVGPKDTSQSGSQHGRGHLQDQLQRLSERQAEPGAASTVPESDAYGPEAEGGDVQLDRPPCSESLPVSLEPAPATAADSSGAAAHTQQVPGDAADAQRAGADASSNSLLARTNGVALAQQQRALGRMPTADADCELVDGCASQQPPRPAPATPPRGSLAQALRGRRAPKYSPFSKHSKGGGVGQADAGVDPFDGGDWAQVDVPGKLPKEVAAEIDFGDLSDTRVREEAAAQDGSQHTPQRHSELAQALGGTAGVRTSGGGVPEISQSDGIAGSLSAAQRGGIRFRSPGKPDRFLFQSGGGGELSQRPSLSQRRAEAARAAAQGALDAAPRQQETDDAHDRGADEKLAASAAVASPDSQPANADASELGLAQRSSYSRLEMGGGATPLSVLEGASTAGEGGARASLATEVEAVARSDDDDCAILDAGSAGMHAADAAASATRPRLSNGSPNALVDVENVGGSHDAQESSTVEAAGTATDAAPQAPLPQPRGMGLPWRQGEAGELVVPVDMAGMRARREAARAAAAKRQQRDAPVYKAASLKVRRSACMHALHCACAT